MFRWRVGCGPETLSAGAVHVWRVPLQQPPDRIQVFTEALCPEEKQRRDCLRSPEAAACFCICRGLLRILLGRYESTAPEEVRLISGKNGKPTLDPLVHKSDIQFNVSHSGDVGLIAIAKGRPVGVDVEKASASRRIDEISRSLFSPQEQASIRSRGTFYACWTRKEALVKAIGGSIAELSHKVVVSTFPRRPTQILGMLSDGENQEWRLRDLPVGGGYSAALCYAAPPAEIFLWQFSGRRRADVA